jgi:UDP-glucose 4-epimerase
VTTVAVTGAGGLLGRALVAALADPDTALGLDGGALSRLVAVDVLPEEALAARLAAASHPMLEPVRRDVRDPDLADAFAGVDVVVHLAAQMDPIRDVVEMRAINVDGTRNVMAAARAAGVRRVVHLSSVVAYGAHPDNPVPLGEDHPLRGNAGFPYAEHKRDVEAELAAALASPGDGPALTVLRSAGVLGPGVQNFLSRLLELPALPLLSDAPPPLQFVHLDDVVGAVVHALTRPLDGAFNVAPDGWLAFEDVLRFVGRRTVRLDPERARGLLAAAERSGLGELPPGAVDLFLHPWVLANDRLRATGWAPRRTNEEALLDALAEHVGWVALGRLRVRRRTLAAAGVAAGTAAVVALARAASSGRTGRAAGAARAASARRRRR